MVSVAGIAIEELTDGTTFHQRAVDGAGAGLVRVDGLQTVVAGLGLVFLGIFTSLTKRPI